MKTNEQIIDKLYELKKLNYKKSKIYNFKNRQKCVACNKNNTFNIFINKNKHINNEICPVCTFCEDKFNNIERIVKLKRINGN